MDWLSFCCFFPKSNGTIPETAPSVPAVQKKSAPRFRRFQEAILRQSVHSTRTLNPLLRGMFHRVKTGPVVQSSFNAQDKKLSSYLSYDIAAKPPFDCHPLNGAQVCKLEELLEISDHEGKLHIESLLAKASKKNSTRLDFSDVEWEVLERVNFILIQEHFNELEQLFNSHALTHIQIEMREKFGIDYKQAVIAETLARSLAYLPNIDGLSLKLPVKDQAGQYRLESFSIESITIGDSLPCFILESEKEGVDPWFIARGTNVQAHHDFSSNLESVFADTLDETGLAKDAITKAMFSGPAFLVERFPRWKKEGKHLNLAGHSLGGYIITDISIRFHSYIECSYAFNTTGVGDELFQKWNLLSQRDPTLEKKLINFSCEGDFVTAGGGRLIGNQIAVTLPFKGEYSDPIHMHLKFLLNRPFIAQAVCNEVENEKYLRRISEAMRASFGQVVKRGIELYRRDLLPDWHVQRHHYRRLLAEYEAKSISI